MSSSIFNLSVQDDQTKKNTSPKKRYAPLAEKMRPDTLEEYIGQTHLIGENTLLYNLLKNNEIPSMILWGPPGCGKTSLINVIIRDSKKSYNPTKFIKLSATTASINDVRKAVTEAEKNAKQGRRTVVFMDEIHRFNKLQQDIFLPHVEAGTFILIGATTENPSSGLNSALLSRCRVFVLKKLEKSDLLLILSKAVKSMNGEIISVIKPESMEQDSDVKFLIHQEVIDWLAEVCDGDARVALGALEIAVEMKLSAIEGENQLINIDIADVKESLLKTQILTDKKSDNLYQLHSALHHSIMGNDDNAALYWLARIMETGEDPVYTATKLIRIASEDICIDDEHALSTAIQTMHACQMIGMPECDVLLGQCVIYLARAKKSIEVFKALEKAKNTIDNQKGPQPKVPLFIKDTSAKRKLRAALGKNYNNMVSEENTHKSYLPEGLENVDFFDEKNV